MVLSMTFRMTKGCAATSARGDLWRASLAYEAIDEIAGSGPEGRPLGKHAAALVGNAVVAARRPGIRGHDTAGQEIRGR